MIHLDTNFLIALELPKGRPVAMYREWLNRGERVGVSALVWTEYGCGPLSPAKQEASEFLFPDPEPYLAIDAALAARLYNHAGRLRGTLMDCMIAAVTIRCQAPLATLDARVFRRLASQGLTVLDV